MTTYITDNFLNKRTKSASPRIVTTLNLRSRDEYKIRIIENLDRFVNLQNLDLSSNSITKIEALNNLINLKQLNLSHNRITRFDGLQKLKNLLNLNLLDNLVCTIPSWISNHLSSLKTLRISDNRIETLHQLTRLRDLSNLTVLDFRGNPAVNQLVLVEPTSGSETESTRSTPGISGEETEKTYRLYTLFHVRTLLVLDDQKVEPEEIQEAIKRFSQDAVNLMTKKLKKRDQQLAELQTSHSELALNLDNQTKLAESACEEKTINVVKLGALEQELFAKDCLLQAKSDELARACLKHYELERELAFHKIDAKFSNASLGPPPQLDDRYRSLQRIDSTGDYPYLGRYRSRQLSVGASRETLAADGHQSQSSFSASIPQLRCNPHRFSSTPSAILPNYPLYHSTINISSSDNVRSTAAEQVDEEHEEERPTSAPSQSDQCNPSIPIWSNQVTPIRSVTVRTTASVPSLPVSSNADGTTYPNISVALDQVEQLIGRLFRSPESTTHTEQAKLSVEQAIHNIRTELNQYQGQPGVGSANVDPQTETNARIRRLQAELDLVWNLTQRTAKSEFQSSMGQKQNTGGQCAYNQPLPTQTVEADEKTGFKTCPRYSRQSSSENAECSITPRFQDGPLDRLQMTRDDNYKLAVYSSEGFKPSPPMESSITSSAPSSRTTGTGQSVIHVRKQSDHADRFDEENHGLVWNGHSDRVFHGKHKNVLDQQRHSNIPTEIRRPGVGDTHVLTPPESPASRSVASENESTTADEVDALSVVDVGSHCDSHDQAQSPDDYWTVKSKRKSGQGHNRTVRTKVVKPLCRSKVPRVQDEQHIDPEHLSRTSASGTSGTDHQMVVARRKRRVIRSVSKAHSAARQSRIPITSSHNRRRRESTESISEHAEQLLDLLNKSREACASELRNMRTDLARMQHSLPDPTSQPHQGRLSSGFTTTYQSNSKFMDGCPPYVKHNRQTTFSGRGTVLSHVDSLTNVSRPSLTEQNGEEEEEAEYRPQTHSFQRRPFNNSVNDHWPKVTHPRDRSSSVSDISGYRKDERKNACIDARHSFIPRSSVPNILSHQHHKSMTHLPQRSADYQLRRNPSASRVHYYSSDPHHRHNHRSLSKSRNLPIINSLANQSVDTDRDEDEEPSTETAALLNLTEELIGLRRGFKRTREENFGRLEAALRHISMLEFELQRQRCLSHDAQNSHDRREERRRWEKRLSATLDELRQCQSGVGQLRNQVDQLSRVKQDDERETRQQIYRNREELEQTRSILDAQKEGLSKVNALLNRLLGLNPTDASTGDLEQLQLGLTELYRRIRTGSGQPYVDEVDSMRRAHSMQTGLSTILPNFASVSAICSLPEHRRLEDLMTEMQSQIDQLQTAQSQDQKTIRRLTKSKNKLETQLEAQQESVANLTDMVKLKESEIQKLRDTNNEHRSNSDQLNVILSGLDATVRNRREELSTVEHQLKVTESDCKNRKGELDELERKRLELQSSLSELESKLHSKRIELDRFIKQSEEEKKKLIHFGSELASGEYRMQNQRETLIEDQQKLNALRTEFNSLTQKIQTEQCRLDDLVKEVKHERDQLEAMRNQRCRETEHSASEIRDIDAKLVSKRLELGEIQTSVKSASAELDQLKSGIRTAHAERDNMMSEFAIKRQQCKELDALVDQRKEDLLHLNEEMCAEKTRLDDMINQKQNVTEELVKLRLEVQGKDDELRGQKDLRLEAARNQIGEEQRALEIVQMECKRARSELDQLVQDRELVRSQLNCLQSNLDDLQKQEAQLSASLIATRTQVTKLRGESESESTELNRLRRCNEDLRAEWDCVSKQLDEKRRDLDQTNQRLNAACDATEEHEKLLHEQTHQRSKLVNELQKLQDAVHIGRNERHDLEHQYRSTSLAVERSSEELGKLRREKEILEQHLEQLRMHSEAEHRLLQNRLKTVASLDTELKAKGDKLFKISKAVNSSEQHLFDLNDTREKLNTLLPSTSDGVGEEEGRDADDLYIEGNAVDVKRLRSTLFATQRDYRRFKRRSAREMHELEKIAEQQCNRVGDLTEQLALVRRQYAQLRGQISTYGILMDEVIAIASNSDLDEHGKRLEAALINARSELNQESFNPVDVVGGTYRDKNLNHVPDPLQNYFNELINVGRQNNVNEVPYSLQEQSHLISPSPHQSSSGLYKSNRTDIKPSTSLTPSATTMSSSGLGSSLTPTANLVDGGVNCDENIGMKLTMAHHVGRQRTSDLAPFNKTDSHIGFTKRSRQNLTDSKLSNAEQVGRRTRSTKSKRVLKSTGQDHRS